MWSKLINDVVVAVAVVLFYLGIIYWGTRRGNKK